MSIRHSQEDVQKAVGVINLEFNVYTRTRDINLGFIDIRTEFKIQVVGEVTHKEIFQYESRGPGPGGLLTFTSQREEKDAKKLEKQKSVR